MKLTLDLPPSSNRYWRMANNRIYRSDEATDYIAHVGLLCATAGIQPLDGDVRVTLHIYRNAKRGDLDNRVKICLDALQSYAYHNDGQVAELHATRHDSDPKHARVEVEVTKL